MLLIIGPESLILYLRNLFKRRSHYPVAQAIRSRFIAIPDGASWFSAGSFHYLNGRKEASNMNRVSSAPE